MQEFRYHHRSWHDDDMSLVELATYELFAVKKYPITDPFVGTRNRRIEKFRERNMMGPGHTLLEAWSKNEHP